MRARGLAGIVAVALLGSVPSAALGDGVRVAIGAVSLYDADAYRGIDDRWSALPLPIVETRRFSLFGPRAELLVAGGAGFSLALVAAWDFAGFDASESDALASLEDRDGSLLGGVAIGYRGSAGEIVVEVLRDAFGTHGGAAATLALSRSFAFGGGRLVPSLTVRWQDEVYRSYYFGVPGGEATAALPAYAARAGFDIEGGLRWLRPFGRHQRALIEGVVTELSDELSDSPVLEGDRAARLVAGWLYEF